MFQIKDFISIVAAMINHVRGTHSKLTDFNVGAINRTLIEAPAIEIEELYLQMLNGLVESIPVAIYQAFDFTRRPATYAIGTVQFSSPVNAQPINIPIGTAVQIPGSANQYLTIGAAVIPISIPPGAVVLVPVQASVAGLAGNALVNTITKIIVPIGGVTAVTNTLAITSGREEETDAERKTRFRAYISTLSRGTLGAVEYAAGTAVRKDTAGGIIEYVERVGLVEEVPGRVSCYIYNGAGSTTDALVTEAQKILDGYVDPNSGQKVPGYRGGGTMVIVRKMTEQPVNFTAVITAEPGYMASALFTAIQTVFTDYLAEVKPGGKLYLSELYARAQGVEGVLNAGITAPTADIAVSANIALVQGVVTLTASPP